MLKDQDNMSQVIVTECDATFMNSIAKVFLTSHVLLCMYHITKNVTGRLNTTIKIKQLKGKDEKMV